MSIRLAAIEYGAGKPVAILHGLFGSGRNWATIAQRLAASHRVIALDLRNHGASPWAETMGYAEMADDVCATLAALGHRCFSLIGHSMGGKTAMVAALDHADAAERLIIVDIAPIADLPAHLPQIHAMRALDLAGIRRRSDADARLAAAVGDPAERAFLLQNLVFDGGVARWRLNLAAIEAAMPVLAGFPAFPPDASYHGPALFVAGARSGYLLPEHEPATHRLFPNARIERIAGAGHWVQADAPDAFLAVVEPFLADRV